MNWKNTGELENIGEEIKDSECWSIGGENKK